MGHAAKSLAVRQQCQDPPFLGLTSILLPEDNGVLALSPGEFAKSARTTLADRLRLLVGGVSRSCLDWLLASDDRGYPGWFKSAKQGIPECKCRRK